MSGPTIGSLFSGYGGIDLGLKAIWPEARTAWVSDIESGPCKVLAHRYPEAPNLGDITKIDWSQVEPVDIITGGSPCQDLSHAGKRAGMRPGTRSGLWASMLTGIKTLRPSLVVWENVQGAYSAAADSEVEFCPGCMGNPESEPPLRALPRVLGDLASLGYDAAWADLRAADVGACHSRRRVFVLAWPADAESVGREWRWASRAGWAGPADGDRGPLLRTVMADEDGGGPLHPDTAKERGQTLRLTGQILALTGDLLPTPDTGMSPNGHGRRGGKRGNGRQSGASLDAVVGDLLPTPEAADAGGGRISSEMGGTRPSGAKRSIPLATALHHALLPTPVTNDMGKAYTPDEWDSWTAAQKAKHGNGNGHGKSLEIETARTDTLVALLESKYGPAVRLQERAFGRSAPAPTQPTGKNGANRLSGGFTEWMMGLPDGWVTDVPGIARNDALRLCGNGVVPQQCEAAVRHLLGVMSASQEVAA